MKEFEEKYWRNNYKRVCGIDEAGRGPLAGPVVAASVIFSPNSFLESAKDSKKLSEKKRNAIFKDIYNAALSVGVGIVNEETIDRENILEATYIAMRKSIYRLSVNPDIVLVDGRKAKIGEYKQESIIKGDALSFTIASSSIIAKVTRDRMMMEYDKVFPEYGFASHKGYGTKYHIEAIRENGATCIHRKSFRPVSSFLPTFKEIPRDVYGNSFSIGYYASLKIKEGFSVEFISSEPGLAIDLVLKRGRQLDFVVVVSSFTRENINKLENVEIDKRVDKFLLENSLEINNSNIKFILSSVVFIKPKPIIDNVQVKIIK
ncbi:MAG: ribonuclease HII [bacterium TMED198]|nr:MAG: ribonuclease HII [bacterium TMED198]